MLIDIVWAGILWLVCSLPVITVGAASAALYYTATKSIMRERGRVTSSFFRAFRDDFKVSTVIWLVYLMVIVPILFLPRLALFYVIPVGLTLPWVFAFISRFEGGVVDVAKSVLYLIVKNIARSIALALILIVILAICMLMPGLIPVIPGAACLMMAFVMEPVFRKVSAEKEDDRNEDQWYNE